MQPVLKKIGPDHTHSFTLLNVNEPFFFPSWHFHPEYEIMYVVEGSGDKYIGGTIHPFAPGDLTLIGQNVPHLYKNLNDQYDEDECKARAIVIYFRKLFLGATFMELPECALILSLLQRAEKGIHFGGKAVEEVAQILEAIQSDSGMESLIDLIRILQILATTKEYKVLSAIKLQGKNEIDSENRIGKVYDYVVANFNRQIRLDDVANVACMSSTGFCRYFKSRTNMTFSKFLNEIRISQACHLLIRREQSISEICYETGYNSIVYFNRQFKTITKLTPLQYQTLHMPVTARNND